MRIGLFRPITLWPFPYKAIESMATRGRRFLVVEMSAGQMVEDVRLAISGKSEVFFKGRTGGGIPEEEKIIKKIKELI